MGTYTPNYNLYMPSIGEQGWGNLVSNNFETLDIISNTFNTQISNINENLTTLNLATASGTRILMISISNTTITSENFKNYAFYDENNVYIASFGGNITFSSIPQPQHSCKLMIIVVNGNATFSGSINTYPTSLQSETPPNSETTNTYTNNINFVDFVIKIILTYTANENNSILNMNQEDYLNFINNTMLYTPIFTTIQYSLSIPHAIAAGGRGYTRNGTAGTATNTCNGGGGGSQRYAPIYTGGTGCIFGQYAGGSDNGYGYGSGATNKYRCGLIFVVNGNLTIDGTITQNGGNSNGYSGGYGGGAKYGGGGGAPVFIYYTGSYTNNGTINTAGGSAYTNNDLGASGGAGGIKTTQISLQ